MASAARDDAGGSVMGFAIVFVSFVFRGFIPAPTWVWLVVLAVGVLLAVKDGITEPIPGKTANQAVQEVVDYYIAGLAPGWTVVERKEDVGYGHGLNAQARFREGDTSNGIGIQMYADLKGRSSDVVLIIQALNCGDDVPRFPPVKSAGKVRFRACSRH